MAKEFVLYRDGIGEGKGHYFKSLPLGLFWECVNDLKEAKRFPKRDKAFAYLKKYGKHREGWRVLAVCLLLLVPVTASAQTAPVILGNLADAVSTEYALRQVNMKEANPVLGQHVAQRVAVKAAGTAVQVWLVKALERRGHPTVAKVVGYSIAGVYGSVAVHNVRAVRR